MDSANLQELTEKAGMIVREAGNFLLQQMGKVKAHDIEEKARNSLVSFVDKQAEEILVQHLGQLLPQAGFLTEEDTVENTEAPLRWIIDPLDGTTNFLHGLPAFSVSVGLEVEGRIMIGMVYEPVRDEFFSAYRGGGAYLNDRRIRMRTNQSPDKALVATGFPYELMDRSAPLMDTFAAFMRTTRGVRRLGSAAIDLAYTAAGRFDLFYEPSLNPWDVAGGSLLVQEAGGRVSDFRGAPDFLFQGQILACCPELHDWALSILHDHFLQEKAK